MGTVTFWGLLPDHHPKYGIKHSNIAEKLTRLNWRFNAIVRDGYYIYILVKEAWQNEKRVKLYSVLGCPDKKKFIRDHKYLNDAIKSANSYSTNIEGEGPHESFPRWTVLLGINKNY